MCPSVGIIGGSRGGGGEPAGSFRTLSKTKQQSGRDRTCSRDSLGLQVVVSGNSRDRFGTVDMKAARQTTLHEDATIKGIGIHSGLPVMLTIHPADADSGISFLRTGIDGAPDREVRADVRAVTATEFATVLGDADGPLCSTAEHVLAALSGLGVDNAVSEIDSTHVRIQAGSA